MNQLLEKFNEYKTFVNYRIVYEFENNDIVEFKFKQSDFPHLIGLHKLIDLPIIRQFNDSNNKTISARYVISKIKKEEYLTEETINESVYINNVKERYERFNKQNILSLTYTDAIVDFDASLIGSKLNANYILFEPKDNGYNHLCIAGDTNKQYAESFFYHNSDMYINNQKIIKVKNVKIYDEKGNMYMEDILS